MATCAACPTRLRRLLRWFGLGRRRPEPISWVLPEDEPPASGVREPRRPRPSASGGAVALELPRDLD